MAVALSVGQCGFDDSRIARMLGGIGVAVERAGNAAEAARKMSEKPYHLVLVNRVFDADGASGVEFIRDCKVRQGVLTPMMLVSDYPEAQAEAVAAGARAGFGKSALGTEEVAKRVKEATGEPRA